MLDKMWKIVGTGALALTMSSAASAALIDLKQDNGGTQTCVAITGGWVCNRTGDAGSVGSGTFPSFVATPGGRPLLSIASTIQKARLKAAMKSVMATGTMRHYKLRSLA